MKYKLSDILIGLLFTEFLGILFYMYPHFSNKQQFFLLVFEFLTLFSLLLKKPFKIRLLFYILLGIMLYINILVLTTEIVNLINPDDGWTADGHRVMQMNWVWGVLPGLVLPAYAIFIYHKKIQRNNILEIIFTILFILLTIYLKH